MPDRQAERRGALQQRLPEAGVDALVVTSLANIRYLTGFTGSAGLLLVTGSRTILVTDFRYGEQAPAEVRVGVEVVIERANVWEQLGRVVRTAAPAVLGYEEENLTARDLRRLDRLGPALLPLSGLVERARAAKDPDEVQAIRAAAALAQEALAEVLPTVRVGETEVAVAARLEAALRIRGSEWHPFPTIVASGPRSALPHGRTSRRTLQVGEWLLLDFGAQVNGYCADLTRTVLIGKGADSRQREVYGCVRTAQIAARAGLRVGMTGKEGDALARDLLVAAGFGDAFGHSLGHGLGLEVHEAPRLSPVALDPLPLGAVVTVEPGIYLPGWGGVRLEDDVWLSPEGPVLLSDGRTELIELT